MVPDALVHALPLNGRSFLALTSLTAGFTGNSIAPSPQGQIYWSNNVIVDGASHFSSGAGRRDVTPEAGSTAFAKCKCSRVSFRRIREALATVTPRHEFGHEHAAQFGVSVRPVRRVERSTGVHTAAAAVLSERFGGTMGGPVIKDRTHFSSVTRGTSYAAARSSRRRSRTKRKPRTRRTKSCSSSRSITRSAGVIC